MYVLGHIRREGQNTYHWSLGAQAQSRYGWQGPSWYLSTCSSDPTRAPQPGIRQLVFSVHWGFLECCELVFCEHRSFWSVGSWSSLNAVGFLECWELVF